MRVGIFVVVCFMLVPASLVNAVQKADTSMSYITEKHNIKSVSNFTMMQSIQEPVATIYCEFKNKEIYGITLPASHIKVMPDQAEIDTNNQSVEEPDDQIEFIFPNGIAPNTTYLVETSPAVFIKNNWDFVIAVVHTTESSKSQYMATG